MQRNQVKLQLTSFLFFRVLVAKSSDQPEGGAAVWLKHVQL